MEGRKFNSLADYFVKEGAAPKRAGLDDGSEEEIIHDYQTIKRQRLSNVLAPSEVTNENKENGSLTGGQDEEAAGPLCRCQDALPSVCKIVQKEGANKGKRFYACSRPRDMQCNFFEWAVAAATMEGETAVRNIPNASAASSSVGATSSRPPPSCRCCEPSILKTVNKDGANKGRGFFACVKPRESGCGFFEWADTFAGTAVGQAQTSGSALISDARAAPSSSSNVSVGSTCYKCGLGGHWAKNCPGTGTSNPGSDRRGGGAAAGGKCFKCGIAGHYSNSCPSASTTSTMRGGY